MNSGQTGIKSVEVPNEKEMIDKLVDTVDKISKRLEDLKLK